MKTYKDIINLQLFAEPTNSTTTLSADMKTFYEKTLIKEYGPATVHEQFGVKRNIPAHHGKEIEFRKFNPLPAATTPLQEGITPNPSKLTMEVVTAEVSQYGNYIPLTDELSMTSLDPLVAQSTIICGQNMGLTMDTVVRDILNTGTNVLYAPKVAAEGTETAVTLRTGLDRTAQLSVKLIQKGVAILKSANARPIGDSFVCLLHPHNAFTIMRDPDWVDAYKYESAKNLYDGELGKIGKVRFVESTNAKIWKGAGCPASCAVYSTLLFAEGAYETTNIKGNGEIIVKPLGSGGSTDPLNQRSSVGWKGDKAAAILVEPYMLRIESCNNEFNDMVEAN